MNQANPFFQLNLISRNKNFQKGNGKLMSFIINVPPFPSSFHYLVNALIQIVQYYVHSMAAIYLSHSLRS